jgi:uncharacterized membrane protein
MAFLKKEIEMEEYVLAIVAALVTLMLVMLVLLVVLLESMGREYRVCDVVGLMGVTSIITACIVSLCALFLVYGPVRRDHHSHEYDGIPASQQASTIEERNRGVGPSQTDTDGSEAPPSALSE